MLENLHKIGLTSIEKAPVTQPDIYCLVLTIWSQIFKTLAALSSSLYAQTTIIFFSSSIYPWVWEAQNNLSAAAHKTKIFLSLHNAEIQERNSEGVQKIQWNISSKQFYQIYGSSTVQKKKIEFLQPTYPK